MTEIYQHFRGDCYSLLGVATLAGPDEEGVPLGAIAFHESTGIGVELSVSADEKLLLDPIHPQFREELTGIYAVYMAVASGKLWVRPHIDFTETVCFNGTSTPRFKKIYTST